MILNHKVSLVLTALDKKKAGQFSDAEVRCRFIETIEIKLR
jgi:hypothetical protein